MAIKKVVPGSLTEAYKKRQGDFSPDLVGFQFTSNGGTPYFTFGNFAITTNFEGRVAKDFKLGDWSQEFCLVDLNLTESQSEQISNNDLIVNLNYNKSDLSRYVYYGSFVKFLESEITDILNAWPASLYVVDLPPYQSEREFPVNTLLTYSYDDMVNKSTFLIPTVAIENKFGLNYTNQSTSNDLNDIPTAYLNYVIWFDNIEYPVIEFTGSTETFPYLSVKVDGDPFGTFLSGATFGRPEYHFKPKHQLVENFFHSLSEFGEVLLDRLIQPKYTITLDKPFKSELGTLVYTKVSSTWPTSDGYNLDTDTTDYNQYLEELFGYANDFDENKTDLVSRRFVSESIHEWDTDGGGSEITGMKVSKLLRIYGREYDECKKYIDGISFANVVTYNKQDNTSDNLIKMMAKTLGFDVLLSLGTNNFNVLEEITPGYEPQFAGYSRELSPREMDIELWRRLVINAWWLFKSKGSRKVLEFFLKLFGINECLVSLDECVYLTKDKINVTDTLFEITRILGDATDEFEVFTSTNFPFDDFGFPRTLPNTPENYFQMDGFWYNGGTDRTTGNNPHYGPYDFGQRYLDQYRCFISDFQPTIVQERVEVQETNFFLDFNEGDFSPFESGFGIAPYGVMIPDHLLDPNDNANVVSAGLVITGQADGPEIGRTSGDTYSMKITFNAGEAEVCEPCQYSYVWNNDGGVYYQFTDENGKLMTLPLQDEQCCDGYWLPLNTQCPSIATMTFQIDGTILSNGEPISPECCTDEVTQYKGVYHDGRNCRWGTNEEQIKSCENLLLSITLDGTVLNNGEPLAQDCCTKTIVGNDVIWDGRNCIMTSQLCSKYSLAITQDGTVIDSNTGNSIPEQCCTRDVVGNDVNWVLDGTLKSGSCKVSGKEETNTTTTLTDTQTTLRGTAPAEEYNLFNELGPDDTQSPDGELPQTSDNLTDSYYCWWCPPSEHLTTACSPEEFISSLSMSEEEFIIKAQGYGFKGTTYEQAVTFMTQVMSGFFTKGQCILMVPSTGEVLSNSACCTARGGTWDDENRLCVIVQESACDPINIQESYNNTNIVIDVSDKAPKVLNQNCCLDNGYYWGNIITVTNPDGSQLVLSDVAIQQALQELGAKQGSDYCSLCPLDLYIGKDGYIRDVNGEDLNQKCCETYGYTYTEGVGCRKCDTSKLIIRDDTREVLYSNGQPLDMDCCLSVGHYWEQGFLAGTKSFACYSCPQTVTINNEIVGGINYDVIRDTFGNSLSNSCCAYYGDKAGELVAWNETVGCYRNILQENNELENFTSLR